MRNDHNNNNNEPFYLFFKEEYKWKLNFLLPKTNLVFLQDGESFGFLKEN